MEEIKDLIEKIQKEGVQAAEGKARSIEAEAKEKAERIINEAHQKAEALVNEAKEKVKETEKNTNILLKQAGRDLLLGLKKEINSMLDKLVTKELRKAFPAEEIAKIVHSLIKDTLAKEKGQVAVTLNKEDAQKLKKYFLEKLGEEACQRIVLKGSNDISAGFIISYDLGKSHFDFTDEAMAQYIGGYLKPELEELLKTK